MTICSSLKRLFLTVMVLFGEEESFEGIRNLKSNFIYYFVTNWNYSKLATCSKSLFFNGSRIPSKYTILCVFLILKNNIKVSYSNPKLRYSLGSKLFLKISEQPTKTFILLQTIRAKRATNMLKN